MESSHSETKGNVLVVEDNETLREAITSHLSRKGYRCKSARNGLEAMQKVMEGGLDAVVTDIHMPQMDGIALTRNLTERFSDLPVMIMTAELDGSGVESALSAGAREVIRKPFELSEFMKKIHKMVDIRLHRAHESERRGR